MCSENSSISQALRSRSIKLSFYCIKQGDFGPWFYHELFTYAVSWKAEISKNFWHLPGKKKDVVKFSLYWVLVFLFPPLYNAIILNKFTSYIMVAVLQDCTFVFRSDNRLANRYFSWKWNFYTISTPGILLSWEQQSTLFSVVSLFLTTLSFESANAFKKGENTQIFSCGNVFTFNYLPFNETLRSQ